LLEEVREGLAWLLARLGQDRYALMCRSAITEAVHAAYLRSERDGLQACKRAIDGSGIEPPDLDDFSWGELMGFEEARARDRVSDALEAAVASGELPVGKRGWRSQQRQLSAAALAQPHPERARLDWLAVIQRERIEDWWRAAHAPELMALRRQVAERVSAPVAAPDTVETALEPMRWFLTAVGDGVRLTATGNLARAFVLDAARERGWSPVIGSIRGEDDVTELADLHETARALRAVRQHRGTMLLTTLGRELIGDASQLWDHLVGMLARQRGFVAIALEAMALAALVRRPDGPRRALLEDVAALLTAEGYRAEPDGAAPSAEDIGWELADALRLLELLGMITMSGGWDDRQFALTSAGEATFLSLLRARATAPREWDGA
jgi:hypothetical protein